VPIKFGSIQGVEGWSRVFMTREKVVIKTLAGRFDSGLTTKKAPA
jgi:hypothetical protein